MFIFVHVSLFVGDKIDLIKSEERVKTAIIIWWGTYNVFSVEAARFGRISNASLKAQIDASYMYDFIREM